jgi:hypothetical protein
MLPKLCFIDRYPERALIRDRLSQHDTEQREHASCMRTVADVGLGSTTAEAQAHSNSATSGSL